MSVDRSPLRPTPSPWHAGYADTNEVAQARSATGIRSHAVENIHFAVSVAPCFSTVWSARQRQDVAHPDTLERRVFLMGNRDPLQTAMLEGDTNDGFLGENQPLSIHDVCVERMRAPPHWNKAATRSDTTSDPTNSKAKMIDALTKKCRCFLILLFCFNIIYSRPRQAMIIFRDCCDIMRATILDSKSFPVAGRLFRWTSVFRAVPPSECCLAVLALLVLVGCRPEVDCVPEVAALSDRGATSTPVTGQSLNESEFGGRYLVLLDRSLGMRGFVRQTSAAGRNLFRPALANLQTDLRAAGGTRIDFWGVSQEDRDAPPVQLQLSEWQGYSAPSNCRPKNELSPTDCPSAYARFGRLEETVRRLNSGGHEQFRVVRNDVVVIITDLQIDSTRPGDPGPLGDALRQLVAEGSAVGILGALSSFTGVIHDLPDTQRERRSRVLDDRRQPFFFIVVGPREPVKRTVEQLEARIRSEGALQADIGSMFFLRSAENPLGQLERRIRLERHSSAEKAVPFFSRGSDPARHVQEGRIEAFKLKRAKLEADPLSPLVTVHMEPEANQQSAVATTYSLVELPDTPPRLWAASVIGGRDDGSCKVRWQPVEDRIEIATVPIRDRTAAGIGLRLRRDGTTIPIIAGILYFLAWDVEVEARTAQVMPDWVQRWDVPFGRVEDLHKAAMSRSGGRDYLGVGNLTELVSRLTAAQVHQSLGRRRVPVRVAFQLEE